MKPDELKRIIPFMEALTEGKRVERSITGHPSESLWVSVTSVYEIVHCYHWSFRIVEPPKPLECWLNVACGLHFHETKEDAEQYARQYSKIYLFTRTAVRMVEAKEGE